VRAARFQCARGAEMPNDLMLCGVAVFISAVVLAVLILLH
jgi:hypothetical protein